MPNDTDTEQELRAFLAMCLDSGRGKRTPQQLVEVMPRWIADKVTAYTPHLAELRAAVLHQEQQLQTARDTYAHALAAWIQGAPEPEEEPQCAHESWEVTSEYRNARQQWVKHRTCADCPDSLDPLVEDAPHWPEHAPGYAARSVKP